MIWRLRTRAKANAQKMHLRREINTLKVGSGEPISMYVARAEDLYKNLTAAGSDMKPEELAFAILAELPDGYGTLVTILETTCQSLCSEWVIYKVYQKSSSTHEFIVRFLQEFLWANSTSNL